MLFLADPAGHREARGKGVVVRADDDTLLGARMPADKTSPSYSLFTLRKPCSQWRATFSLSEQTIPLLHPSTDGMTRISEHIHPFTHAPGQLDTLERMKICIKLGIFHAESPYYMVSTICKFNIDNLRIHVFLQSDLYENPGIV